MKTEQELIKIAQTSSNDAEANLAMKELRERFSPSYGWCADCDFLVIKAENCCHTRN
jgi:hypothetical protein